MVEMKNKKTVIWLAGDSITQSYKEGDRPQTGWGEYLLSCLEPEEQFLKYHRISCPFEQEIRYEGRNLIVDNCAMAGRSSKTFLEEGRLEDIKLLIKKGDYLFIQFGHNDASSSKPERYVPVKAFAERLMPYIEAAKSCGAIPVLLSSVALCPDPDTETGEKGEIVRQLPAYGKVMRNLAKQEGTPYVDMGDMTRKFLLNKDTREAKELYMPDYVHLSPQGAKSYAELVANQIKELIRERS